MTNCHVALLPDRGIVEAQGPDATEFLQDLVTNDVEPEQPGEAAFAALLTPQGRILFDFFILRRAEQSYWIDCAKAQAADLVKRLTLYKLRAKITITDRSDELAAAAAWGACDGLADTAILAAYADPRYAPLGRRLIVKADAAAGIAGRLGAAEASEADYTAMRIAAAMPQGGVDYIYGEAFPHEASFDDIHGVDFGKGCYVGQEVVARMHHLGTAKTRVAGVELDGAAGDAGPLSGREILAGEMPVGRLGSVDGSRGIAIVRLDRAAEALASGTPLNAGGATLRLTQPPWARYQVPGGGAAA